MERKRLVLKANNITENGIKQNETKTLYLSRMLLLTVVESF